MENISEILSQGYTVYIGNGCAAMLNDVLQSERYREVKKFIFVDENTHQLCFPVLSEHIQEFINTEIIEIESGEENKNIEVCAEVWRALSELEGDRQTLIINLGGGVMSDMGGFIASCYKRGIDFINMPTTLLSQVDASVGGKLGIDLDNLKNQIGVFNYPKAIFIDPIFLKTLPFEQLRSGFAEIIKHGLIADAMYFQELKNIDLKTYTDWHLIIERSVNIKNKIVLEDPREKGIRKALNYGHTIGHAIESWFLENGASPLLHGEAIAIGMIAEGFMSNQLANLSSDELVQIKELITGIYDPVVIDPVIYDELIALMMHDKKNENAEINFTLLNRIGEVSINHTASADIIKMSLDYYNSIIS